ncbi:MAG: histidine phosphatase family protein [Blastocatellia bacterium]|nr:histidine phosphatase family protein [Blastocatellia bacterium]
MKTLMLLRHAKSSWDDPSLRDFERPLAPRGGKAAPRMGKALAESGPLPDLVISSPATRARQTAELFIGSAGISLSPQFDDRIYAASSAELMKVVRAIPDASDCALLIGHNPGFEDLVARLTGSFERMPTAALACIEFPVDRWEDIEDGEGKLNWLLTPKDLKK